MSSIERLVRAIIAGTSVQGRYMRQHLQGFAHVVGPRKLVFDVGGGNSLYKRWFPCGRYISMDVRVYDGTHVLADACQLPFGHEVSDLVLCTEVLEHVTDSQKTLAELGRVLMPGGYLVVSTPLVWGVHDVPDFRRWTDIGIVDHLRQAGFEVVAVRKRGGIFTAIGALLAQAPLQVFLPGDTPRTWPRAALFIGSYLVLAPLAWSLRLLDFLDRQKNFTVGYCVLCRRPK